MNEEQLKYYKLTKVTQRDLDEGVWDAEHKGLYSKDGKRFLSYYRPDGGVYDTFSLMAGVEVICDRAFSGAIFKSFEIPDTIVAIGEESLRGAVPYDGNHKSKISFPKNLKYVGNNVFGHEEGVFDVVFEDGLQELDLGNIMNFGAATTVYLPSTLTSIGEDGFGESNNTVAIHIADGNKHFCIEDGVLYNKTKTKLLRCPVSKRGRLVVPDGVKTVGRYAFRICGFDNDTSTMGVEKMSIILPPSLQRIESGAFRHSHLNSLYIGSNVSLIEDNAFEDHYIKEIIVLPDNPFYESCYGMLIDKRSMELVTVSGSFTGKSILHTNFEVKNNVLIDKKRKKVILTIGYTNGLNAFVCPWDDEETKADNAQKDLEIPKGVEMINSKAFSACGLYDLKIPEGVTYIGENAFSYMTARSIYLPSTICFISPSTITSIFDGRYQEGEFYFYVPKGLKKKFEKMGIASSLLNRFFKEIECKDYPLPDETKENDFIYSIPASVEDLEQSIIDKHKVRYGKDGKRLLKFEGFHSRLSTYKVEEGTEFICEGATAAGRYQYVRLLIVPASVKYIGSCPSFDRLLLFGNKTRFAPSTISLRKNDTVYIPCGTWNFYNNELEKARRGPAPKASLLGEIEDFRLVELSKSSVAMYLKQQQDILTGIITTRKIVSEYTVNSINGDSQVRYVCYRDRNRMFFLNAELDNSQKEHIFRVLYALGMSYQTLMDILEVDIDDVEVNEDNISSLEGKVLASHVYITWTEEFCDEYNGEITTIERSELLFYRGEILVKDDIRTLIESRIPVVSVLHDSYSHDKDYLNYFANYREGDEMDLSPVIKDSILRCYFPNEEPQNIKAEDKFDMAYNLIILIKALIDHYGYIEGLTLPLKAKDEDMHSMVSDEEERLSHLITQYYQQMIDKVLCCKTEQDVMPLFPDSQNYFKLKTFLVGNGIESKIIDSFVTPAIGIIQIE